MIMEQKLNLFGHDSRLVKLVVFGMVDGTGIRGRPSREWLDDVKNLCQMDVHAAINKQPCTIKIRMEEVCGTRGRHQRALSPWRLERWMMDDYTGPAP